MYITKELFLTRCIALCVILALLGTLIPTAPYAVGQEGETPEEGGATNTQQEAPEQQAEAPPERVSDNEEQSEPTGSGEEENEEQEDEEEEAAPILSGLTVSDTDLNEPFDSTVTTYTADVANTIETVTISATPTDDIMTVTYDPTDTDTEEDGHQVNLTEGENTVTITVTAEDGVTVQTYTLTITRAAEEEEESEPEDDNTQPANEPADDEEEEAEENEESEEEENEEQEAPAPTLIGLTVSDTDLNETFDPTVTTYTADVANTIENVTVTATADNTMTVAFTDTTDADTEEDGQQVNLTEGENTVTITVTAEDGVTVQTYTLTVTRAAEESSEPEDDDTQPTNEPADDEEETVEEEEGEEESEEEEEQEEANENEEQEDEEETGEETLAPTLSGLTVSDTDLNEPFDSTVTSYTADVANDIENVTVTPTADDTMTVAFTDTTDADTEEEGHQVNLTEGENTVTITVTAQDGVTVQTYTLTITRAAEEEQEEEEESVEQEDEEEEETPAPTAEPAPEQPQPQTQQQQQAQLPDDDTAGTQGAPSGALILILKPSSDSHRHGTIDAVTALPGSPTDGTMIRFTASATSLTNTYETNGITVKTTAAVNDMFRYESTGTKWVFMGNGATTAGISSDVDGITNDDTPTFTIKSSDGGNFGGGGGGDEAFFLFKKDQGCAGLSKPSGAYLDISEVLGWSQASYQTSETNAYDAQIVTQSIEKICLSAGFTDDGQNTSNWSELLEVTIDTTATTPTVAITSGVGTSNPTVRVSSLEPGGATAQLFSDSSCSSSISGTATTGASETHKDITTTTSVAADASIYAKQTDVAGNTACSAAVVNAVPSAAVSDIDLKTGSDTGTQDDDITSDTTAPEIGFTQVAGATITARYRKVGGSWTAIQSGSITATGTAGTITLPLLTAGDGAYEVEITQDDDGNGARSPTATTYMFTLDITAPTVFTSITPAVPSGTPTKFSRTGGVTVALSNEDRFGSATSLSADGTLMAVGVPDDDDRGSDSDGDNRGAVYLFQKSGATWQKIHKFSDHTGSAVTRTRFTSAVTDVDLSDGDNFGSGVSLSASGTLLAVGARNDNTGSDNKGVVHLFQKSGTAWSRVHTFSDHTASTNTETRFTTAVTDVDISSNANFGSAVSLSASGTLLAVGASAAAPNSKGAVYLFEKTGALWSQSLKISDNEGGSGLLDVGLYTDESFGTATSLSASGTLLAVGAPSNDDGGIEKGAAYLFEKTDGSWAKTLKISDNGGGEELLDINLTNGDHFGSAVSLAGTALAVGAYDTGTFNEGSIHLFEKSRAGWSKSLEISENSGGMGLLNISLDNEDEFGSGGSLSADGTVLAAGAPADDDGGDASGAVYLYGVSPVTTARAATVAAFDDEDSSTMKYVKISDSTCTAAQFTGDAGTTYTEESAIIANTFSTDNGKRFCFRVQDAAGNIGYGSSVAITITAPPAPPATPDGLTGTWTTTGVTLNWTDPNDNAITKYQYQQCDSTGATCGSWTDVASSGPTTVTHPITSLTANTGYTFKLRAVNASANSTAASIVGTTGTVYDTDTDGLIDINTIQKLNAIRYDLNGDGTPASGQGTNYTVGFPNGATHLGCPGPCTGYELTADLDLNDETAGIRTDDTYYNGGSGWEPIGTATDSFTGTFNGRGFVINNLSINRTTGTVGLFGNIGSGGTVTAVGIRNADVNGGTNNAGALAGSSAGTITASFSAGTVAGGDGTGGLVGDNSGTVEASYSTATVTGTGDAVGGLVGSSTGSGTLIRASYALGAVTSATNSTQAGGLVGTNRTGAAVTASYHNSAATSQNGEGGATGKTPTQLQTPTGYTGIYATWDDNDIDGSGGNDAPWDFGSNGQYPVLSFGGHRTTMQRSGAVTSVTLAADGSSIAPYTGTGTHRTRDATPTISFTAVANATTTVKYRQGTSGAFTDTGVTHYINTGPSTSRNALLPTLNTNGTYQVEVTQDEDGVGGKTASIFTYTFIFDTLSPTVTPTIAKTGHTQSGDVDYLNVGDGITVTLTFNEDITAAQTIAGKFINDAADIPASGGSHHTITAVRTDATTQTLTLTVRDAGPDVAAGDLKYQITNGAALTDLAGNTLGAQSVTAIASTVIDTTKPTLTPTKTGTGNAATYRVTATDISPVTGRTKDNVILANCTDTTTTDNSWTSYTPGDNTGTADDTNGRCVIITDAAGNSKAQHLSDSASVTAVPAAPTGLTTHWTAGGVTLNWTDPSDSTITKYQYQQCDSTGATCGSWTDIPSSGATTTTYPVTALSANTGYTFKLRAVSATGDSIAVSAVGTTGTVYDTDTDGLIDINTIQKLNAIRYDLNGDGTPATGQETNYTAGFPNGATHLGCPGPCTGYELTADLDLNDNGSGRNDDTYNNSGAGWEPIGADSAGNRFTAIFNGNGFVIDNLLINRGSTGNQALFAATETGAHITAVGLRNVNITGANRSAALVGASKAGTVINASFSTGSITGALATGGLVGYNEGTVEASYSAAAVSGTTAVGGLVGNSQSSGASIKNSYAYGAVTQTGSGNLGGLVGNNHTNATITNSYWDTASTTSAGTGTTGATGKTPTQLQTPVGYTGIYSTWDDSDIGGTSANDAPWDFGTNSQYPVLSFGGHRTTTQRGDVANLSDLTVSAGTLTPAFAANTYTYTMKVPAATATLTVTPTTLHTETLSVTVNGNTVASGSPSAAITLTVGETTDITIVVTPTVGSANTYTLRVTRLKDYDDDDDGLIDIRTHQQLNAIRWDLDGDGTAASGYTTAFPHASTGMGCKVTDHDNNPTTPQQETCTGYELRANINLDTNGNGTSDHGDAYYNNGYGWVPIGQLNSAFNATFSGNGHTISNLHINRTSTYTGLFGFVGGSNNHTRIEGVGLKNVSVRGGISTGALAGRNEKPVTASWVTGAVRGTRLVGGLIGQNTSTVTASYSLASVNVTSNNAGGLIGQQVNGGITASYASGKVTGSGTKGGLVAAKTGSPGDTNNYYNSDTSGMTASALGTAKTDKELRTPTGYTGIYQNWNVDVGGSNTADDPWSIVAGNYPVLDYGAGASVTTQRNEQPAMLTTPTIVRHSPTGAVHTDKTPTFRVISLTEGATITLHTGSDCSGAALTTTPTTVTVASSDTTKDIDSTFVVGSYTIFAKQTKGNISACSSGVSFEIKGTPAAPANIAIAPGDTEVTVSWDNPNNPTITKYQYQQKTGGGNYGSWTDISGSDASTLSETFTGLTNGTAYQYKIRAVNAAGDGAESETSAATPLASISAAPASVSLALDTNDNITPYITSGTIPRTRDTTPTITFTAVGGATTTVKYRQGTSGAFSDTGVTHTGTGSDTARTATLPTLSTNGTYQVEVTQDEDGIGSTKTVKAVTYTFIFDTQAPTVSATIAKTGHALSGGVDYLSIGDTITVTFTFNEDITAAQTITGKFVNDGVDIPSSVENYHTVTPARTSATAQTLTLTVRDAGPDVAADNLKYQITNGTALTDLAGNALGAQSVTAIANTVIDTTKPALTPTKVGTGNAATYKVAATDISPVSGRTKDNVASGSCTDTTTTGGSWSDYTPGTDTGTAHDTAGRCVIITDAAGNKKAQHLSDSDNTIQADFTMDITGNGTANYLDAIVHYYYAQNPIDQSAGGAVMANFINANDSPVKTGSPTTTAAIYTSMQNSATTRDFTGNGTANYLDAIVHYYYAQNPIDQSAGGAVMANFINANDSPVKTGSPTTTAAIYTLLQSFDL